MEKMLKIYEFKGYATPFPNAELQAELYSFQYDAERMGTAPTITATVMYPLCLDAYWNSNVYVEFRGEKYFIDLKPSSSYSNTEALYKHELTFVSERKILENVYFTDGILTEFHFYGDIHNFAKRMNSFLEGAGLLYRVIIDENVSSEEKDFDINKLYVNDAFAKCFELFNIPYYYIGKDIHFGFYQNEFDETLEYGVENALLSIKKDNSNKKVITKITGVGSSENIPYYYPNFNESGNHNVTTRPEWCKDHIIKLNYLKIDPYTHLRNGGWAKYEKATVSPIGVNDTADLYDIALTFQKLHGSEDTQWRIKDIVEEDYEWEEWTTFVEYEAQIHGYIEISHFFYDDEISLDLGIKTEINYGGGYINGRWEVKAYYFDNIGSGSFFYESSETITDKCTLSDERLTIPIKSYYNKITISYTYNIINSQEVLPPDAVYASYIQKFIYHSNLKSTKKNVNVDGENYNIYFNKVIDYPDGTGAYRKDFIYVVTRDVAGYSNAYMDTVFKGLFLNADGDDMSEWMKFYPDSIVVRNSKQEVIPHWLDKDSNYIHFRNTTNVRDTYTIEMSVSVNMLTPMGSNGLPIAAYGVELEYIPDFGRAESSFDMWKLHDGEQKRKYTSFGIKFDDVSNIPDSTYVDFSETIDWIEPKPYLMPPEYRVSIGKRIWYYASDGIYTDENGNEISFENQYKINNPKEHISDPKDDIKPTIVGMTNTNGQRIDMFTDIAYDDSDNNEEWVTDEDGEKQTLKHSFFYVKLRRFDGENGFNLFEQALEAGEMTISMTSGHCGGCNFTIMVDEETQKNVVQVDENGNLIRDENGNVKIGNPQERQQDTSANEVWIALRKEEDSYGIIMPDKESGLAPTTNDTFVFTNILLPDKYITDAEQKLEWEILKDLKENNSDKFNFNIDFSRIYFTENPIKLQSINENSMVKVKYNGITYNLYANSFSYKADSNDALPQIQIELKENLSIVKNAIQKTEGKIIRYVNEVVVNEQKNSSENSKRGDGSSTQNNSVDIVQTTGDSITKVMSQKAVTDALKDIEGNDVEVTQYMGQSTKKVMSQKSVTDELNKLKSQNNTNIKVVQTTGSSVSDVMSQKATTDAVYSVDKILPFNGFIDEADILNQTNPYEGGKIYFVKSVNRFAYYREQDGIYTALWNGYGRYATIITGQGVIPNSDRVFVYNSGFYLWDGETLVGVGDSEKEIPLFSGIVRRATVVNQTGFYKYGDVYFIESPSIDGVAIDNGIFAYKIRDTYYRSWDNVAEYMNTDLSEPISDKLFEYNNQQYVYKDRLDLLTNINRLVWEEF